MKRHAKPRIRCRKPIYRSPATNPKAQDNVDIKKDRFNLVSTALGRQMELCQHIAANPSLAIDIDGQFKRMCNRAQSNPSLFRELSTLHTSWTGEMDALEKQALRELNRAVEWLVRADEANWWVSYLK